MVEYKKLTIRMHPDAHAALQRLAEEQGCTVTDLIKRSVALNKFVWEHRDAQLLIKEGDTVTKVVMV